MVNSSAAWFEQALDQINKDLGGALGSLSKEDIDIAKTAMLSAMRATITANPQGFREMLTRLSPHKERVAKAAKRAADAYPF